MSDNATPPAPRTAWPLYLELLDRALRDGVLTPHWVREVTGPALPDGTDERVERLLDPEERRAHFDAVSTAASVGRAALAAVDRWPDERLLEVLAEAVAAGDAPVLGCFTLVARSEGNEFERHAALGRFLSELSEKGVRWWPEESGC